jgi:crotonobetainyl-CoA:carnitine CoA-transferase CaiB-like acyl-CoA transferase
VGEGVALATDLGLDPVVSPGGVPSVRNPIGLSRTSPSYRLPPPGLDEHGDEIRAWLGES